MKFYQNASLCLSSRRALGWFLTSLDKMKLKNFRPKQILVCEAFLAISFHKNKMDEEAVDYFMKSLESKSKSLPDQILFDFLRCGMNALKNLKKKEELVQFQKIKFQFRNDLFSIQDSLEKTCKYYSFGTKASQMHSMWQNIWNLAKVPAKPGTWNPCSVDLSSWSQNKQN